MNDIAPALLEKIRGDFQSKFDQSEKISRMYAKVRDGTATYVEANEFAVETGEILADAYKKNLSSEILPDGKMYYNIAERVIGPTMTNNYELITEVTDQVQRSLNESANVGIKPITPELNQDRIDGVINKVSSAENYDDVAWVLDEPVKVFSQSIVDDAIKSNIEFQYDAGLSHRIIRTSTGKCCEWCQKLAGTYSDEDTPADIYRRHDYCRCTVEYVIGKERTNVHNGNTGKRRYIQDKYGGYVKTKEARIAHAKQMEATEKERKAEAREKRIETWRKKKLLDLTLENKGESGTIKLQDTLIHKSVGAKSRNYDIIDPVTGEVFHFAEGTRIQNAEVFAGKGTRKSLHEGVAEGLSEQIGGTPENWQHCKGNGVIDYYGEERPAEVHWFQEESVGKVKFKVKEWKDED